MQYVECLCVLKCPQQVVLVDLGDSCRVCVHPDTNLREQQTASGDEKDELV